MMSVYDTRAIISIGQVQSSKFIFSCLPEALWSLFQEQGDSLIHFCWNQIKPRDYF